MGGLMPDISVVALNYNTRELLRDCLLSLFHTCADLDLEVIVVDNASKDASADMVREEFPGVKLIANSENTGYSRGTNVGIRASSAPYVLLLNPDTVLTAGALRGMYEYLLEHADTAMVSPRMVRGDGEYQQSCHYFSLLDAKHALFYLLVLLGGPGSRLFGLSSSPVGQDGNPKEVDWVYTACALARREALDEVGLLDEGLFMYGEDMDLCYRVARAGWKTVYLPQVQITHYGNESGVQVFGEQNGYMRARMYVKRIDYFQRKHFSALHSFILRVLIGAGSLVAAVSLGILYLLKGRDRAISARGLHAARIAAASFVSLVSRRDDPGSSERGR